jgi:VWFA-related protein
MKMLVPYGMAVLVLAVAPVAAQEATPVFRTDVTLVRVDAQVVDRAGQRITGLSQDDFRLLVGSRPADIRAFAYEQIPLDVLLLIDVSGSMRPHVERIAMGARSAMRALGPDDRVAITVFDRRSRNRLEFEPDHDTVAAAMEDVLDTENFNSGTAITRAMKDSADWVAREARRDARRAIVILTDDESGDGRDDDGVLSALDRADAALSVLMAPASRRGRGGAGGGVRLPTSRRGGIIFGPRFPIPQPQVSMLESAGVREIARETGGDTFRVDESDALRMTFARLRQRYALFYSDPTGAAPVQIALSDAAARRYPGADVVFRRASQWGDGGRPEITRAPAPRQDAGSDEVPPAILKPPPAPEAERKGGWRKATPEDLKPPPPALHDRGRP